MVRVLLIAVFLVLGVAGYRLATETARDAPASLEEAVQAALGAAGDLAREGGQQLREGVEGARELVVGGIDVGRELREATGQVQGALDTARGNLETPQAALPGLRDAEAALGRLEARLDGFSAETRHGFATLVAGTLPAVRGLVGQIKANPQAAETLGSTLDAIVARLEGWARGPVPA